MDLRGLERLDLRAVPDEGRKVRLFSIVRNETLRLPYFLEYYRRLGVQRFFFVSNNSTDDTVAFLTAQPDCHVFSAAGSFAESQTGIHWMNSLLDVWGPGHWIIRVDADELLVYPRVEQQALPAFCSYLERGGFEGAYAMLLDMYAGTAMSAINYKQGEDFLKSCGYFDGDYQFVPRLRLPFAPAFPKLEPLGGPRSRLFFPEQHRAGRIGRLWLKAMFRLMRRFSANGATERYLPAPQLFKIPLVRWQRGYRYMNSHRTVRIKLAPVTIALLHFKYFQDFHARVMVNAQSGEHFGGAVEYKRYARLLQHDPDLNFLYEGSRRYGDSDDLVRLGLISDHPDWQRSCGRERRADR